MRRPAGQHPLLRPGRGARGAGQGGLSGADLHLHDLWRLSPEAGPRGADARPGAGLGGAAAIGRMAIRNTGFPPTTGTATAAAWPYAFDVPADDRQAGEPCPDPWTPSPEGSGTLLDRRRQLHHRHAGPAGGSTTRWSPTTTCMPRAPGGARPSAVVLTGQHPDYHSAADPGWASTQISLRAAGGSSISAATASTGRWYRMGTGPWALEIRRAEGGIRLWAGSRANPTTPSTGPMAGCGGGSGGRRSKHRRHRVRHPGRL